MTQWEETWAEARQRMQAVCDLLVSPSPDNLDRSASLLAAATIDLRTEATRPDVRTALGSVEAVHELVHRAGTLLEGAAEYHRRWRALAGSLTAGYTPGGRPGEFVPSGRVCVQG